MAKLNEREINLVLTKIKNKYQKLISEFKKSRTLADGFEERYFNALKSKIDLSTFLLAEIEAVEELYKREEEKKSKEIPLKKQEQKPAPTIADKVYEENKKRIEKYPRLILDVSDADEDTERLLGGVREFINSYFQAITTIYKERRHTNEGEKNNNFSNKFLSSYDYKGEIPIARQYVIALQRRPRDFKKIEYEHKFVLKETAFLLNEILDLLESIAIKEDIPQPDKKLSLQKDKSSQENKFYEYFNNLTYKEAFEKVRGFLKDLITDFRFKDIKRGYTI
ncbi:MAG TPA: hypothetical protein PLO89_00630 [Spirochaetota bacterium]|nr:hypothetical protein [Spirochaetota bacterium]